MYQNALNLVILNIATRKVKVLLKKKSGHSFRNEPKKKHEHFFFLKRRE